MPRPSRPSAPTRSTPRTAGYRAPLRWDGDVCWVVDQRRLPDRLADIEVRGAADAVTAINDGAITGGAGAGAARRGDARARRAARDGVAGVCPPRDDPRRRERAAPDPPRVRGRGRWPSTASSRCSRGSTTRRPATRSRPRSGPRRRPSSPRHPRTTARSSAMRWPRSRASAGPSSASSRWAAPGRWAAASSARPCRRSSRPTTRSGRSTRSSPRPGRASRAPVSRPGSWPRPACRHALVTDAGAAAAIAAGEVDAVLVTAERICANGDVLGVTGTYPLALAAAAADVPFVVLVATTAVDLGTPDAAAAPLEEGRPRAVLTAGGTRIAPEGTVDPQPAARSDAGLAAERDHHRGGRPPGAVRRGARRARAGDGCPPGGIAGASPRCSPRAVAADG